MHDVTLRHHCSIQFHAHRALKQVLASPPVYLMPWATLQDSVYLLACLWELSNPVGDLSHPE